MGSGDRDPFSRPPTAQEAVLVELRKEIASGALRPGEQVLQEAIADRLGVSRVPLREALKILEGEGQVVYHPHRGYFVAELSVADLVEVYRIRDLLEAEAVEVGVGLRHRPSRRKPSGSIGSRARRPPSGVTWWA